MPYSDPVIKREKERQWNLNNPEKLREYRRKWKLKNIEKVRKIKHKWAENNPGKVRENQRRYEIKRRHNGHRKEWQRQYQKEYRAKKMIPKPPKSEKPPKAPRKPMVLSPEERLEKKREYDREYSRKRIALVTQDPESRRIYLERRKVWAQTYRDRNREKLIEKDKERRQQLKSIKEVIPVSNKAAIDNKVFFKKKEEKKKYAEIHKKRQVKRKPMIVCPHNKGFKNFTQSPLGGVSRTCKICGKKFRQVGR